jgi:hypothetical protein
VKNILRSASGAAVRHLPLSIFVDERRGTIDATTTDDDSSSSRERSRNRSGRARATDL